MDKFIEDLCHAGLNIEIIADNDWLEVADAWCIPEKAMISMPENLYMRIINKDTRALHIFFMNWDILCWRTAQCFIIMIRSRASMRTVNGKPIILQIA